MSGDDVAAHLLVLASLPGVGPATLCAIHEGVGARSAWEALVAGRGPAVAPLAQAVARQKGDVTFDQLTAEARRVDPVAVLDAHRAAGALVLVHGDAGYPQRLVDDPGAPALLLALGHLDVLDGPVVAIVGTRNATRLGCDTAARLGGELAARGVHVASGLALGIDGAAHRGALGTREAIAASDGPGAPIGVVASGFDRPYPRRHRQLHDVVADHGVLLGETPLGGGPQRWRFPARNRILAGIADAVVVVESRSAGGSMLTAAEALARGVPVLAVPGHPTHAASAGTLDLICEGAQPVRDVDDVLVAIGRGGTRPIGGEQEDPGPARHRPSAIERAILSALDDGPATLERVVERVGEDLAAVSVAITHLEAAQRLHRSGSWLEHVGARGPSTPGREVER